MQTILERYTSVPRPRPNLADWLASLPNTDRAALFAATHARALQWDAADRAARLRNMADRDLPAQTDALTAIADQVRGLRDDLSQRPVPAQSFAPRPRPAPQYSAPPMKPPATPTGVTIPTVE